MLGEFKSDQLVVEKKKLANNLYVKNLNHLSQHKFCNTPCAANNFKNNKRKQLFQILTIHCVGRILK